MGVFSLVSVSISMTGYWGTAAHSSTVMVLVPLGMILPRRAFTSEVYPSKRRALPTAPGTFSGVK